MSILRIKNQDGSWTYIPAIRGDRGPEGPQGPQGLTGSVGESGVHLGPDEPTDPAIRVWIDTSGTGADIQDYARRENVLTKSNQGTYVPQQPYNPATKKYVDDSISSIPTPTGGDNRFIHLEGGYNFYKNYDNSYDRFGDSDKLKLQEYINSHYDGSNISNLLPLEFINNYSTSSYSDCDVLVITDVRIPYAGQINLLGYVNKLGGNLGYNQSHYSACYDVSLFATTTGDAGNYTLGIVGFRSRPRPISPDNITGYSRSGTQVLKNINGTLTWVNET